MGLTKLYSIILLKKAFLLILPLISEAFVRLKDISHLESVSIVIEINFRPNVLKIVLDSHSIIL